jgi:hypothetical protein
MRAVVWKPNFLVQPDIGGVRGLQPYRGAVGVGAF